MATTTRRDCRFTQGQTVVLTGPRYSGCPKRVPVKRTGRKYVYVQDGPRELAFGFDGRQTDPYKHYSIHTVADWEAAERRSVVMARLRDHGFEFDSLSRHSHSTTTLEKIANLLDEESRL